MRRALERGIVGLGRDFVDQALRVLIAALLERRDRREAIGRGGARIEREDRRARLAQRRGGARIALLGELRLERRQRLGVARFEHRFGRRDALLRVGIGEGQRAERRLDRAAQRVVDANLLEGIDVDARQLLAGLGVDHVAGLGAIDQDMRDRIDQQAIVAERLEDRRRIRRPARREFADRLFGARELVVEELRQRVVERVGAREARAAEEDEGGEQARDRHGERLSWRATPHPSRFARHLLPQAGEGTAPLPHRAFGRTPVFQRATRERGWGEGDAVRYRSGLRLAHPPHLPVLTFRLPQDSGLRQSAMRSREPSR